MHTLEPELRVLHAEGLIDDALAARAVACDRGHVFSLHGELRTLLSAGVLLALSGVGLVLARHLDRIGPLGLLLAIALLAIACAGPAVRARRTGSVLTIASDSLLLLAVLLLSVDLAYAERQFGLLGPLWSWHLLLLAIIHAGVAYAFGSSLVLGAALAALAGWFGVGNAPGDFLHLSYSTPSLGARALACAAVVLAWRQAELRVRPDSPFGSVFDHFAANMAFWGAITWCLDARWFTAGIPLLAVLGFRSVRSGLRTGREAFLVYGTLYPAMGICAAVLAHVGGTTLPLGIGLIVVCLAAAALWGLRRHLREPAA